MKITTSFFICLFYLASINKMKSQVYSTTETNTINGLCVGCSINNATNSIDTNHSNYEIMNLTVSVLGANIGQKHHFPISGNSGDFVGIIVEDVNLLVLDVTLLSGMTIKTYNNGISNNDLKNSTDLSISLFGGSTSQYEMKFQVANAFDEVEIIFNAGITGAINNLRIYYAQHYTSTPLPIDLMFFNAQQKNKVIELNWSTASEQNNSHFTIEKSIDAITYYEIAKIKGFALSLTQQKYSYEDSNPYKGITYYRLKQTDFDGRCKYFNPISFNYDTSELAYSVSPNPYFSNDISFTIPYAHTLVEISNVRGEVVFLKTYDEAGLYKENLRALNSSLTTGIHFISFNSNNGFKIIKALIQ